MLAVDGEEPDIVAARLGHDELAGEHENLLGGEREVLAGADGGEGGLEAGGADYGDEHEIGLGEGRQRGQALETVMKLRACGDLAGAAREGGGVFVEQRGVGYAELAADLEECGRVLAGGDADELKFVGMRAEDAQGVFADGAGGAEEDDAFAGGRHAAVRRGRKIKRKRKEKDGLRAGGTAGSRWAR